MAEVIMITGGARSGKSRLAEEITARYGDPLAYIATCEPLDQEMCVRIERHRSRRGDSWTTFEEPLDLAGIIARNDPLFKGMLVDCITIWLSNLLLRDNDPKEAMERVKELITLFSRLETPLVLVSNEVGMGIVPDNTLARTFRDLSGDANDLLAQAADEVYVTFSGLPLKLKG